MNWTDEAFELMKNFTETQRKLWQGWFDLAGQSGDQRNLAGEWFSQWQDTAKKSLDAWQSMSERAAEVQAEWVKSENFASMFPQGSEEARKLVSAWSEQTAAIMRTWTESQKGLWEALFDLAGSVAKTGGTGGDWLGQWESMTRQTLASWEDVLKRAGETQQSWFESFNKDGRQQDDAQDTEAQGSAQS